MRLPYARYVGAQTLSIVYGYRMTEADDLFLKLAEQTQDMLSNDIASGGTGMWMVDILPFRRRIRLRGGPVKNLIHLHSETSTFMVPRRGIPEKGRLLEGEDRIRR